MTKIYEYDRPGTKSPDLDVLEADIVASAMMEKDASLRWDEADGKLKILCTGVLSIDDKSVLDLIAVKK